MTPYIAVSYHDDSNIEYVRRLASLLQDLGIGCWYLETVIGKRSPCQDYLSVESSSSSVLRRERRTGPKVEACGGNARPSPSSGDQRRSALRCSTTQHSC